MSQEILFGKPGGLKPRGILYHPDAPGPHAYAKTLKFTEDEETERIMFGDKNAPKPQGVMYGRGAIMDHDKWKALSDELAIEHIVSELADMMVPVEEGRQRANQYKNSPVHSEPWQKFQRVVHDMESALIHLEKLGYRIVKNES